MNKINVRIKLLKNGTQIPEYATQGSAAVDLRSAAKADVTLNPGERALIPTGIAIAPDRNDVVAILAARSGLAVKHGITVTNGIGVIDSDYRGEISVSLCNVSDKPYTVSRGDRIAQLMFMSILQADFTPSEELDDTERGTGGFGSTGKN